MASIVVSPANTVLKHSNTVQYKATGMFSDGSMQDLTTQVTWTSSDPNVATVSNAAGTVGLATAVGQGMTTVTASMSGITGSAQLRVM